MDELLILTLNNTPVRAYVAVTSDTVEKMNELHDTTPSAAAAAGRTLTATAIMGAMLKNDTDLLTVTLRSSGEIRRVTAVGDSSGKVKCEILNPHTSVRLNEKGKIDVAAVVEGGTLTIIKDLGEKQPYVGQTKIVSGEIAEDFAFYFAKSEQIPSIVSLGVFVGVDLQVKHAGGFIVQTLPGIGEEALAWLEEKAATIPSVTQMLRDGYDARAIAGELFNGLDEWTVLSAVTPRYECNCSREKTEQVLLSMGAAEIGRLIEEDGGAQLVCHFCNKAYDFSREELQAIYDEGIKEEDEGEDE